MLTNEQRTEILAIFSNIRDAVGGDEKPYCCWQDVIDGDYGDAAVMSAVGGAYSRAGAALCKCTEHCNALGSLLGDVSPGERESLLGGLA